MFLVLYVLYQASYFGRIVKYGFSGWKWGCDMPRIAGFRVKFPILMPYRGKVKKRRFIIS